MRRLLLSIAFVLILASRAWPDCSTLTPNLGLAPCTVGTSRSISDPAWINNFKLLDINAVAPLAWIGAGSISPQLTLGTVVETLGGTGQITYTKGDTLYASATNTLSKLNGNTTTTRKFREQHGNGTAVTVDAWDTIQGPDITSGTINPARVIGTVTNNRCVHVNGSGALVVTGGDCAQSTVTSGNSFDASGADYSIPWKIGTTTPGTCGIGQAFFDTDATAGSNIYACTASNVWTLEGGGGGSGDITDVGSCTTGACFTSVAQNLVLASPTGSTGAVTSRSLINADLPDSGVTGTTCGDTTHSCGLTYNSKGVLTAVTNNVISGSSLEVKEIDTSPDVTGVSVIQVSNGTLTNNGGGNVTITTGGGGGGITGTLTASRIPVASGSSTVVDTANFTFDTTNFRHRMQNMTTATDNTLNMLQLSGALPASPSTTVAGVVFDITSAGSAAQEQRGLSVTLPAGYSGSSATTAIFSNNPTLSTGATMNLGSATAPTGNLGARLTANGSGAGNTYGVMGEAISSTGTNTGVFGRSVSTAAGQNIGVLGNAASSGELTDLKNVGVYGTLNSSLFSGVNGSFAGLFDGGTLTDEKSAVLYAKGTLPASPAAGAIGVNFPITSAGSASFFQIAQAVGLNAGYSGSSATYAIAGDNAALSTGTNFQLNSSGSDPSVNIGTRGYALGAGAGGKVGIAGFATDSTGTNVGSYGRASGTAAGTNIGVLGNAANSGEGTDLRNVAGYFTLNSSLITASNISAAIVSDGSGSDILRGYNAATLKARIGANGEVYVGNFTVGALPTCGASDKGLRATITDNNAACTFVGTPTGSGSTTCPAYCDGAAWKIG